MGAAKRIAFLGIGLMGKPMARRLLNAGHKLVAWNRTIAKAKELEALGAIVANTATDAVFYEGKPADIVITMLESGAIVEEILRDIVPNLSPDTVVVDMSSTKQSEAQLFHALLASHLVTFVDAPVSGGVIGAEAGTLAIMAGGEARHYAAIESILQVMGRPTHVGGPGCGQLAKLCNQLIVGGTLNIVAEALLLAQAGGADPAAVRHALRGGFAESRILEVHGQRMLDRNFMPGGQVKSQAKDMENVMDAALRAGLDLPLTALTTHNYRDLLNTVPQADQSAALLGLEMRNPGIRLGVLQDQLP